MAARSRTDQPQRSGPAGSTDDNDVLAANDLPTSEAIAFIVQGMPLPITIESLQKLELFLR